MPRCAATTRAGTQCQRLARDGAPFCPTHERTEAGLRAPQGRHSEYTPEAARVLLGGLAAGLSLRKAASLAGVSATTAERWQGAIPGFADEVEKALAMREASWLAAIRKAAGEPRHWTAAAWLLERTNPDEYARRERMALEHSGPGGGPIQTEAFVRLSNADLARIIAEERAAEKEEPCES